jgi:hypothetical protein
MPPLSKKETQIPQLKETTQEQEPSGLKQSPFYTQLCLLTGYS